MALKWKGMQWPTGTEIEDQILQRNITQGLAVIARTFNHATDTSTGNILDILDGSTSTLMLVNTTSSLSITSTWDLDLGRVMKVHNTTLSFSHTHTLVASAGTITTSLYYSLDNDTYTLIEDEATTGTDPYETYLDISDNDLVYRYLRITVNTTTGTATKGVKLRSLQLLV